MKGLIIRLKRKGGFRYPVFDIVVIKKTQRMRGRCLEKIGVYNPNFSENFFFINTSRLGY
jgi:ribosomal protein S16